MCKNLILIAGLLLVLELSYAQDSPKGKSLNPKQTDKPDIPLNWLIQGMTPSRIIGSKTFMQGVYRNTTVFLADYSRVVDRCIDRRSVGFLVILTPFNSATGNFFFSFLPEIIHDGDSENGKLTIPTRNFLKLWQNNGWNIYSNSDGTFSLKSKTNEQFLCVVKNPVTGVYNVGFTDSASSFGVKFLLYKECDANEAQVSIYNPATKTFLNRVEPFDYASRLSSNSISSGNQNIQVEAAQVIGIYTALTARSISSWNMVAFSDDFSEVSWRSNLYLNLDTYTGFPCGGDCDGDGHKSILAMGDDCNDNDARSFPGNFEVGDTLGHDEDCDCNTYGEVDLDGDGFFDERYFNRCADGTVHRGTDCNDTNAAIFPGEQIYINEYTCQICHGRLVTAESGYFFVKQPNGTAVLQKRQNH